MDRTIALLESILFADDEFDSALLYRDSKKSQRLHERLLELCWDFARAVPESREGVVAKLRYAACCAKASGNEAEEAIADHLDRLAATVSRRGIRPSRISDLAKLLSKITGRTDSMVPLMLGSTLAGLNQLQEAAQKKGRKEKVAKTKPAPMSQAG